MKTEASRAAERSVVRIASVAILLAILMGIPWFTLTPQSATAQPESSATTWVAATESGLTLTMNLSRSIIGPGEAVSVLIVEKNTLDSVNNLPASQEWPVGGLTWGPCGTYGLPAGMLVVKGNYSVEDIATAEPLLVNKPTNQCPTPTFTISDYTFQPESTNVNVTCGTISCGSEVLNLGVDISGYWTNTTAGAEFTNFPDGVYTVVAGDEWGKLVVEQFQVTPGGEILAGSGTSPQPSLAAEILGFANDWGVAILSLMVPMMGFGIVILMRRRMTKRELAPMLTPAAASGQPPLPDTRTRCEYCGAEQSISDTCIQCGASFPRRQAGMTNSPERLEVAVGGQSVKLASGAFEDESPRNKTHVDLRSYSASRWKVALPAAMIIYAGSIPLVTYGISDASLFDLLLAGLVGLFFGGPVALSYGIALFFQARNDDSIIPKVMAVALIILVVSSIAAFEVLSYVSIKCNNPSAYWWDWRDFYAKCNFYPPTN